MVAQTCNPSYSGGRELEDQSLRSALAKRLQDRISTKGWVQWHMPGIPTTWEAQIEDYGPGIKKDPFSKITNTKKAGE
jgi:hypothetical protein